MNRTAVHEVSPRDAGDVNSLLALDPPRLVQEHGVVLFRGFDTDGDAFNSVVAQVSSKVTIDPARTFHGDSAQLVDSGDESIGLHLENGATPFAPELLWFHCVRAAEAGSETTVCDGRLVHEALSQAARDAFGSQPIRYSRTIAGDKWRRMASFMSGGTISPSDATVEQLADVVPAGSQFTVEHRGDDALRYTYDVWGVGPSRWSDQPVWASSIFGPSYNYEAPTITFRDSSPLSAELLEECRVATERVTADIVWRDGDVVLIDNSRVMHGRRPIIDPRRTIVNAQSYLDESFVAGA